MTATPSVQQGHIWGSGGTSRAAVAVLVQWWHFPCSRSTSRQLPVCQRHFRCSDSNSGVEAALQLWRWDPLSTSMNFPCHCWTFCHLFVWTQDLPSTSFNFPLCRATTCQLPFAFCAAVGPSDNFRHLSVWMWKLTPTTVCFL